MNSPVDKEMLCDTPTDRSVTTADGKLKWDVEQEQRAKKKRVASSYLVRGQSLTDRGAYRIDMSVLPLLVLGLLMFQLDRMNLASALTAGFAQDIHISQDTVNLGNQLMFMGTVVLEIPCNLLLQRFGPRKWISFQVLLFGVVGVCQVFVKDRAGFLAIRLCLGFAEAGYIPASIFTLSTWYTTRELAKRVAIFMFGQFGGNGLSPLLASGILKLEGHGGLKGWQWLFLLEGIATLVVALMFIFLLPGSPETPRPIGSPGLVRFSKTQREILQKRLSDEETVKKTAAKSLGFDRISANALAAVGACLSMVAVFGFATLSDKTNKRGGAVLLAHVCYLTILVVTRSIHPHVGKWSRWALWTAVNSFAVSYHPTHNTWLQVNCREPGERSIAVAMWVMSAISGLMVGTQFFVADDLPFYNNGLLTMIIMVSVGMAFALIQESVYFVHNRRVSQGKHTSEDDSEPYVYVY
ncbi:putative transporter [Colletotrichum trifolii]|uniref:Putative transporter n=1 Tax=Colletotrichum trifolii TaxID=5466 RepID=A0A4V3HT23_COLTR|nr:putative transporter [Colletotrichum trifolii]